MSAALDVGPASTVRFFQRIAEYSHCHRGGCAGWLACRLLGLAVLGLSIGLRGLELGNLLLDGLVDACLQLRAVAQLEEKLEPDEQRGQEDGLDQIIQQSRGTALKGAVSDELEDPANNVDADGDLVGQVGILEPERVAGCSGAQADGCQQGAGDRLEEHIQSTPGQRCKCSQVKI